MCGLVCCDGVSVSVYVVAGFCCEDSVRVYLLVGVGVCICYRKPSDSVTFNSINYIVASF